MQLWFLGFHLLNCIYRFNPQQLLIIQVLHFCPSKVPCFLKPIVILLHGATIATNMFTIAKGRSPVFPNIPTCHAAVER
jgi:hypothetical protein